LSVKESLPPAPFHSLWRERDAMAHRAVNAGDQAAVGRNGRTQATPNGESIHGDVCGSSFPKLMEWRGGGNLGVEGGVLITQFMKMERWLLTMDAFRTSFLCSPLLPIISTSPLHSITLQLVQRPECTWEDSFGGLLGGPKDILKPDTQSTRQPVRSPEHCSVLRYHTCRSKGYDDRGRDGRYGLVFEGLR